MRYRHFAFTLLLWAAVPLDAGQPLRMTVIPMKCFEPADLQVRVWIEPHADNRESKVYLSKRLTSDVVRAHTSTRTVVYAD